MNRPVAPMKPPATPMEPAGRGMNPLIARLEHGLVPAVPVPFAGRTLREDALAGYAAWMRGRGVAGVAVNVHTGRGRHLAREERARVLRIWREALPDRVVIAGAWDEPSAAEAREGGADALLAFPSADNPIRHHERLGRILPVVVFYLYQAAGGVGYDPATLRSLLRLPAVIGIKVATLDSVITFQEIARLLEEFPDRLLITGEDRFLGYSLLLGARGALVGLGAAATDLQAELLRAHACGDWARFVQLSACCDRLAQATFTPPMEGYVRRMLWAAAADGALPDDACDDPWGPALDPSERERVRRAVRDARAACG